MALFIYPVCLVKYISPTMFYIVGKRSHVNKVGAYIRN